MKHQNNRIHEKFMNIFYQGFKVVESEIPVEKQI